MSAKNEIVKTIQSQMIQILNNLSTDSIEEIEDNNKQMNNQYEQLKFIAQLPTEKKETPVKAQPLPTAVIEKPKAFTIKEPSTAKPQPLPAMVKPLPAIVNAKTKTEVESDRKKQIISQLKKGSGILKRNLHHGYLETQEESIFVPESIIRRNGFQQGDILSYQLDETINGKDFYTYRLIRKSKLRNESIMRFNRGVIELDPSTHSYIVRSSEKGEMLKDYQELFPYYKIPELEVKKYNLDINSIVDLAWYYNNTRETLRIVWKH